MEDEKKTMIWKSVETTDPKYTKAVSIWQRSYTAVDAHYQILQATKLWGPYGSTWGVVNELFTPIMTGGNDVAVILYSATFNYPEGSFPLHSDTRVNTYVKKGDYWKITDDFAKKVATDALTKGLSKLGFAADVFMGVFDGNKYDGIESYDIDFLATDSQKSKLKGYVKRMKELAPEAAQAIDEALNGNLKADRAERLITRAEDKIKELGA